MKHALLAVLLVPAAASASFRGPARIRGISGALGSAPRVSAAAEQKLPDFGALGALMMANPGMTVPHELRDDELERGPAPAERSHEIDPANGTINGIPIDVVKIGIRAVLSPDTMRDHQSRLERLHAMDRRAARAMAEFKAMEPRYRAQLEALERERSK